MAQINILGLITAWWLLIVILTSSLLMNLCQVFALYVTPFIGISDYKTRLAYSQAIANTWWQIFCFVTELWSGIEYRWTGQLIKPNDNAILIGNHERGIDFVTGVCVSSRAHNVGCGRMMTMMKQSLQYLPIVGFTHTLQGSLFLKRNWQSDQTSITQKLKDIEQNRFPRPFWIGIYPEGTRITPVKRSASQTFATEKGLPKLNNVLLPRTKGFTYLLQHLPTSLDCVYDVTAGYTPNGLYLGDVLTTGEFACKQIHLHIERIDINKIPDRSNEKATAEWLVERFQQKDKLLEYFNKNQKFEAEDLIYPTTAALYTRYRVVFFVWSLVVAALFSLLTGSKLLLLVELALTGATIYKSILYRKPVDKSNYRNHIPPVEQQDKTYRDEDVDDDPDILLNAEGERIDQLNELTKLARHTSGNRFADEIRARKLSLDATKK